METIDQQSIQLRDIAIAVFAVLTFILVLEIVHPFYFLKDDNRTYFLPMFFQNWRAVAEGTLAFFNFHQYLGIPHYSAAQPATFYPLLYGAMACSQVAAGHLFWTIDILVTIHLCLGAAGVVVLCHRLGIRRRISWIIAVGWAISPLFLITATSWWNISGFAGYLPWMAATAIMVFQTPSFGSVILLVLFRLLLLLVGHPEFFLYACICEFLLVVLCLITTDTPSRKGISRYVLSILLTVAVSLPFVLPLWVDLKESIRIATTPKVANKVLSFRDWFIGQVFPFSRDLYQGRASIFWQRHQQLSHSGYVIAAGAVWGIMSGIKHADHKHRLRILMLGGTIVFFLAWSMGAFNLIVHHIPILNQFRWTFKMLCCVNFFLFLLAGYGLGNLVENRFHHRGAVIFTSVLLVLVLINMGFLFYGKTIYSFNSVPHTQQPPFTEPLAGKLTDGRTVTLKLDMNDPFTSRSMGFNYATMWDIYHLGGYDPLVPKDNYRRSLGLYYFSTFMDPNIPIDYFRLWGVRYYVMMNPGKAKWINETSKAAAMQLGAYVTDWSGYKKQLHDSGLTILYKDEYRTVLEDSMASPLVFWQSDQDRHERNPLDYEIRTNEITIQTRSERAGTIVVNFLYNKDFHAIGDNQVPLKIDVNPNHQMLIHVPPGASSIHIEYRPFLLWLGLRFALIVLTLTGGLYLLGHRKGWFANGEALSE